MSESDKFLKSLANDLMIKKSRAESREEWILRLFFSAAASVAKSSLELNELKETNLSIQLFKQQYMELMRDYLKLFPEVQQCMSLEIEETCEEFYRTSIKTGAAYHMPHRIARSKTTVSQIEDLFLYRGESQDLPLITSGSGKFSDSLKGRFLLENVLNVVDMFDLFPYSIDSYWGELLELADWELIQPSELVDYDFLAIDSFEKGYWRKQVHGSPSLARKPMNGDYAYFLYQVFDDQPYLSSISDWRTSKSEYFYIANSFLKGIGKLPPIDYIVFDNMIKIHFNYLLPPAEMAFFKYYSWPVLTNKSNPFERLMHPRLFEAIKGVFEDNGYRFNRSEAH